MNGCSKLDFLRLGNRRRWNCTEVVAGTSWEWAHAGALTSDGS